MFVRLYKLFRNEKLPELIGIILLSFLYTIFSVYEFFRYFIYLIKLRKLYNIHSGKRCFIIGNGPSLKSEDLDKLRDEISFASNGIYLIFPYDK